MPEAENQALPGGTNDSWRTWLMTGARRSPVDRRRMRGGFRGLKKMLIEGMANGDERPHAWKDFSGAMIRHAVDEAMRSLPATDTQVVKLAYFGGYSNREIASQVGLTEATVQRRLHRALAAISDYMHRGRQMGRRALYALLIWITGRSLSDATHQVVQAAVVAAATTIIVTHQVPALTQGAAGSPAPTNQVVLHQAPAYRPVVPPMPSPTSLASPVAPLPAAQIPSVQVPPVSLPVNPPVAVPPVPTPPVKTPAP